MKEIELAGPGLRIDDVVAVARQGADVRLAASAREEMERSASLVDAIVDADTPVYGVTTGFGSLANTVIPPERTAEMQLALIRSHAAGMGDPVEPEVVRAMLFLRARSLVDGRSGCAPTDRRSPVGVARNAAHARRARARFARRQRRSRAACHCALALIGEGEVWTADGETSRRPAHLPLPG